LPLSHFKPLNTEWETVDPPNKFTGFCTIFFIGDGPFLPIAFFSGV
jgi:hypothetical protein